MENRAASFSLMKQMNISLILRTVREKCAISRAQIAKETGLTPATVTNITARLIEAGLLCEADWGKSTGGRKPVLLRFDAGQYRIAAAYFAPDGVSLRVVDLGDGLVYQNRQRLASGDTAAQCVDFVAGQLEQFAERERIVAVGIAVHGLVDAAQGVSLFAPNLGWRDVPVRALLEQRLGLPVFVENDVRLMTLSERWYGAAKQFSDFAFVYAGKGLGGALVLDGKLYRGSGHGAGEIGHTTIDADGPLCSCGNRGCLQALASEDALLAAVRREVGGGSDSCLTADADMEGLLAAAEAGDALAVRLLDDEARYLGLGISNIAKLFNPEAVVFATGTPGLAGYLLPAVRTQVQARMMDSQHTAVLATALGGDAVLRGAAALVLDYICEEPFRFLQ